MASKPQNSVLLQLFNSPASDAALKWRRVLQSAGGIDATLMLAGYTLTFASVQVARLLKTRLAALAEQYAQGASKSLSPGETLVATLQLPTPASRLADAHLGLKALAGHCSDVRTFTRLWSVLTMWGWAKQTLFAPPKDTVLRLLNVAQLLVNSGYVLAEHRAYLAMKGVYRGFSADRIKADWVLAGKFFGAHLLLDFVRLWRVWQIQNDSPFTGAEEKSVRDQRKEDNRLWWKALVVDAAYLPMAVELSYAPGWCGEEATSVLGMIVGYLSFKEAWNAA